MRPWEPHTKLHDWSGDVSCVPHIREQRGAGHQEITESPLQVLDSILTQDWNQKTSGCQENPRKLPVGVSLSLLCCGSISSGSPCGSPAPLPGRRFSGPWTMGELISGFLSRPKSPLGIGHSSGNPHVPWCCSSCSRLWLISRPWKFSLCTDLIQKVLFISQSYHSLSLFFLLTFLHLTEFNCLVCSLFTSQIRVVYTTRVLVSHSPSRCVPP